jgi:arginine/ornithine N-succinyltransferase beta subunit
MISQASRNAIFNGGPAMRCSADDIRRFKTFVRTNMAGDEANMLQVDADKCSIP